MPDGDGAFDTSMDGDYPMQVDLNTPMDWNSDASGNAAIEPMDEFLLTAPIEELNIYEPLVRWLLGATPEQLASLHCDIPDGVFPSSDVSTPSNEPPVSDVDRFSTVSEARFARAEVEAELEAIWDELSRARREWGNIDGKLLDLEDEREDSKEQIALLESRISKLLQDRDLAIAQKYTTEKKIREAESFKSTQQQLLQTSTQPDQPQALPRNNSLLGFLRRGSSLMGGAYSEKDVDRLQKEIADVKVETALAKTDLDAHYYRLRQIEKKCAGVKLEIAQASALEDDLQVLLLQLTRERRYSAEQLHQISTFSAAAAKQLKPSDQVFKAVELATQLEPTT